jgi:hypothetical protein
VDSSRQEIDSGQRVREARSEGYEKAVIKKEQPWRLLFASVLAENNSQENS